MKWTLLLVIRANAETALFLVGVEDSHHLSNNVLLNQWDQFTVSAMMERIVFDLHVIGNLSKHNNNNETGKKQ